MNRLGFVLVLALSGCSIITVDLGDAPSEVWMAQKFEWGDRCGGDPDGDRPLVLSWLEEEGVHPLEVRRFDEPVDRYLCTVHREIVYVLVRDADQDRMRVMGFSVQMPPPR